MADDLSSLFVQPVAPRPALGDIVIRPFDPRVDRPRQNADGSVSTELTRTIQVGDGWVNVPSLWFRDGGASVDAGAISDDLLGALAARYEAQSGQSFPRFGSLIEAEQAARARSLGGGAMQGLLTNGR